MAAAVVDIISTEDLDAAVRDTARSDMAAGPAKDLLERIAQFETGDYDPGDVFMLIVRPTANHRSPT